MDNACINPGVAGDRKMRHLSRQSLLSQESLPSTVANATAVLCTHAGQTGQRFFPEKQDCSSRSVYSLLDTASYRTQHADTNAYGEGITKEKHLPAANRTRKSGRDQRYESKRLQMRVSYPKSPSYPHELLITRTP
jgi:hypothetical protein